jgi:hypothetical protein
MSSQKFTMADVELKKKLSWRTMVAENEIRLLKLYFKQDLGYIWLMIKAERNAWILSTL